MQGGRSVAEADRSLPPPDASRAVPSTSCWEQRIKQPPMRATQPTICSNNPAKQFTNGRGALPRPFVSGRPGFDRTHSILRQVIPQIVSESAWSHPVVFRLLYGAA